jgi:5,10-methylenetetrahydromethanopterin reductase
MTAFQNLQDVYGNRFALGLAPGDIRGLKITGALTKHPLQKVKNCIREVRKKFPDSSTLPIYVGASGPKMVEIASKMADGVLLNYVYPEFISWALRYFKDGPCRKAAYGPTLLKPEEKNIELLRVSAAIVLSGGNKTFLREFGLEETASEVNGILHKRQFHKLRMYDDLLLSKFAISGSLCEVEERVDELKHLGICQVVFATPLCRDVASIKKIGDAFS